MKINNEELNEGEISYINKLVRNDIKNTNLFTGKYKFKSKVLEKINPNSKVDLRVYASNLADTMAESIKKSVKVFNQFESDLKKVTEITLEHDNKIYQIPLGSLYRIINNEPVEIKYKIPHVPKNKRANVDMEKIKLSYEGLEELFFNKELSDIVRDVVKNSPITLGSAYHILSYSNDYKRDSEIINKLSRSELVYTQILQTVKALNL